MTLRRETTSLCPECLRPLPARYEPEGDCLWMEKTCPDHGSFRTLVWRGPPSLEEWSGGVLPSPPFALPENCPLDCGSCPPHDGFG